MTPRLAAYAIAFLAALALAGYAGKRAYDAGYWAAYGEWQAAIAQANAEHDLQLKAINDTIKHKDKQLEEFAASQAKTAKDRDDAIELSRGQIALSDACTVCRVPGPRVNWMREKPTAPAAGGDEAGRPRSGTGTNAGTQGKGAVPPQ